MNCKQKKIAVINDLSGYGRCSLTVALPIISSLKIQCCPVPTAILSNHTEFTNYFFDDYTSKMNEYIHNWKLLNLSFDGILTGFLGSKEQINIVTNFITNFPAKNIIVDPVMGDNGKIYATYTDEMCEGMKTLVKYATIITPNLTEACRLTDTPYLNNDLSTSYLIDIAIKLCDLGPGKVVITGINIGSYVSNFVYYKSGEFFIQKSKRIEPSRPGTGDVFSSIVAADAINGIEFKESVKKASDFIQKCIIRSEEMQTPPITGVCFEELLYLLN